MSKMTDSVKAWIQGFNSGAKWLNKIDSPKTLKNYLPNLKKYCDSVKKNPDELIALKIEGLQNIATEKEFIAEDTLETFLTNSKTPLSMKKSSARFYNANRRNLNNVKEISAPSSKEQRTPTSKT